MATSHNSYCNTEIAADQPQLVRSLLVKPPKNPENACGLPSSSLTRLEEEVQGPPAGEWCPRIQKIRILETYSGGPRLQIFGFQKCLLIFENPQKPNYMLQILGKNTEAKFFCGKKAQKLKNSAADEFFWILEDLGAEQSRQSQHQVVKPNFMPSASASATACTSTSYFRNSNNIFSDKPSTSGTSRLSTISTMHSVHHHH